MLSIADLQFLDSYADLKITRSGLPHWHQPGATYFITYRTSDSISQHGMNRILSERNHWLKQNGIDPTQEDWSTRLRYLSKPKVLLFQRMMSTRFEQQLDRLEGKCHLKNIEIARIVSESLRFHDGVQYRLAAFVVMPNHIHVLVRLLPKIELEAQCYNWKHFQATQINKYIGRKGAFFQSESFDHIVRDVEHFQKFRIYIRDNPLKAKLREGCYSMYLPEIEGIPFCE